MTEQRSRLEQIRARVKWGAAMTMDDKRWLLAHVEELRESVHVLLVLIDNFMPAAMELSVVREARARLAKEAPQP